MLTHVSILALISALFYCIAMFAMKSWAEAPNVIWVFAIGVALLTAGAFEVMALKQERLGMIYIGILAAEVVFIGSASVLHFEETYSTREVVGIGIVLLGTAVAWV